MINKKYIKWREKIILLLMLFLILGYKVKKLFQLWMINDPIIEILKQDDDYGITSLRSYIYLLGVKILNFAQE